MLTGTLHVMVAFDWGDEIDLDRVRQLATAQVHVLPRRRRTPSSIAYHPPPVQLALKQIPIQLPSWPIDSAQAVATLFDFGAVSVELRIPFQCEADQLLQVAG